MKIPEIVRNDIEQVVSILNPFIKHYGIFGSLLYKEFENTNDIDVVFVYEDISYEEICKLLNEVSLKFIYITSYRNYMKIIADPPIDQKYYDFVFIPIDKPDREFLLRHNNKIHYISSPYKSWKKKYLISM